MHFLALFVIVFLPCNLRDTYITIELISSSFMKPSGLLNCCETIDLVLSRK